MLAICLLLVCAQGAPPAATTTATYTATAFRRPRAKYLLKPAGWWPGKQTTAPELSAWKLLGDFGENWTQIWKERRLARHKTRYEVVEEDGDRVLRATSDDGASALWRRLDVSPQRRQIVSWRWKVQHSLSENANERDKKGDDYAARLFVIFTPDLLGTVDLFNRQTRAVSYVWAGSEPVGSTYLNPYFPGVGTLVLRTGDEGAGQWIVERRNFVVDYRVIFGEDPETLSAIALVVDTDNTGARVVAWFDDLVIDAAAGYP